MLHFQNLDCFRKQMIVKYYSKLKPFDPPCTVSQKSMMDLEFWIDFPSKQLLSVCAMLWHEGTKAR